MLQRETLFNVVSLNMPPLFLSRYIITHIDEHDKGVINNVLMFALLDSFVSIK